MRSRRRADRLVGQHSLRRSRMDRSRHAVLPPPADIVIGRASRSSMYQPFARSTGVAAAPKGVGFRRTSCPASENSHRVKDLAVFVIGGSFLLATLMHAPHSMFCCICLAGRRGLECSIMSLYGRAAHGRRWTRLARVVVVVPAASSRSHSWTRCASALRGM